MIACSVELPAGGNRLWPTKMSASNSQRQNKISGTSSYACLISLDLSWCRTHLFSMLVSSEQTALHVHVYVHVYYVYLSSLVCPLSIRSWSPVTPSRLHPPTSTPTTTQGPLAPVKLHNSPKHRLAPVTLGGGGGVEGRRESSPGTYNTSSAATSSTLQTVYSLPPSLQPTTRAAGPSYAGMYGNRLPTSLSNGFHPSNQFRGIPNPASLGAAAMPHRPPMNRLATCACHDPTGQTSHFYSSACMGGGRRDHTVTTSHFQPQATPQVSPTTQSRHERGGSFDEGGSADDLSMTWPRVMRERSGGGSGAHITADASALAEGGASVCVHPHMHM